ncbi:MULTISPECIES: hypothetical protein [Caballeronia]|uniref:Uncharacterized protein n=1 Tax=Caballeronia zhejiangensis TaxID=871203 RepID=A0A656QEE6_9BURK|nr:MULTISPECIES: hypothetical protein [Caballeronia]KDR28406.1 hypothetical protein BG60_10605 [Caballeronia zhejiangensis]MCE4547759.1 hypothetical protein [Caballeronia sp. PC1]MCE4575687.1 hypothetical protein [Caballeronia sp. CLC5]
MNTKTVGALIVSAVLLGASAVSMAAGAGVNNSPGSSSQSREHGPMMGMGGMMGGCPMMGGTAGMDPKTAMKMHGEMMRAMGDIMLKYSDQAAGAPSK